MASDFSAIITRKFTLSDVASLRTIRLESLANYGSVFANFHAHEAAQPLSYWQQLATESRDSCFFGMFAGNRAIGILGAKQWEGDRAGKTVLWYSAFIEVAYRQKLSTPLYQLREQWCRDNGYIKAVFYILPTSKRSAEIHLKHGANFVCTLTMTKAGGPATMWNWYDKLLVQPDRAVQASAQAQSTYDQLMTLPEFSPAPSSAPAPAGTGRRPARNPRPGRSGNPRPC